MEETETQKTKVSDSGYSNSCSNSQSQRSSGSSKSRHSTSSGSSGYCAHLTNNNDGEKPPGKRKDKEHKKKKDGQNSLQQSSTELEPLPPVCENAMREETTPEHSDGRCHETLQLAAITQTFSTVKRLRSKEQSPDVENSSPREKNITQWTRDEVMQLVNEEMTHEDYMRSRYCSEASLPTRATRSYGTIAYPFKYHPQEELGIIVSMEDGLVLYITPALTDVLGYPKDMWIGRSLIDLIHPKHRASFAGHITSVIANNDAGSTRQNPYSCYLRQYRGLRSSGFSVTEKWVGYLPLQLNISFQQTIGETPKLCLVITAAQIKSAYKYGDETRVSVKFTTRHTASSQLCHVDPEVTPYFGYLPQDIIGRSILEFYHPEDLHFLKEVYEAVMKEEGHLFRSKPYRFRCQNGCFALVETELSSFINPWSRKLEFIICQHTVLRGPPNPDVTTPVAEPEALTVSEELLKETKIVHEEIKHLLNDTVVRSCKTAKQQVTKRCKDLAAFMENLMDELTKPPDLKVDVPMEEQSFSERDSVMLGEISPHHEFYDSKSSSETPPSYNQLNYNENIQRFFESKPKTTLSEESSESKVGSGGEEGKISPVVESIVNSKSGESSGAQSTENSGEVNINPSNNNPSKKYKPTTLTEQLLSRHNEDMEKRMVQKHREQRSKSDRDMKIKERLKTTLDKPQEESSSHGIKRSGSHSWEGEPCKAIKSVLNPEPVSSAMTNVEKQATILPAFPPSQEFTPPPFTSTLMPMYYLPNRRPDLLFPQQIPYMGGMVYQPVMFGTQPLVYTPLAVVPSPDLTHPPGPVAHEETVPPVLKMSTDIKEGRSNYQPNKSSSATAQDQKTDSNGTSVLFDDSSSSFYSLLKTDKSDESLQSSSENDIKQEEADWRGRNKGDGKTGPVRKGAPWIEDINVTPELILKYQVKERPIEEVLYQDLQVLQSITQPELVSEQLSQMYLDLELEGLSRQLTLEEASSSSESSGDEAKASSWQKNNMEYDRMVILFEEDAPLPSPLAQGY
ncbi:period circadian protein isoform X2 [Halyomorpha halys]|uniref:period circadian protein isoform X2 n=1 Tax=Halyomorpha halys TaxID=286706 RepID=UPI0006D518A7|nr:period circadian protein isoform X2 [Halyomorpha halys]